MADKKDKDTFFPAHPKGNGGFAEVAPNVFVVRGSFDLAFAPGKPTIARYMFVVRENGVLSVINSVRLNAQGEAELDALGKVGHVFKIGSNHGADDPYFLHRYKANNVQFWALEGMSHPMAIVPNKILSEDSALPFPAARVFIMKAASAAKMPEAVIRIDRSGGVLMCCDMLTNYGSPWEGFSTPGKLITKLISGPPGSVFGPWLGDVIKKAGGGDALDQMKQDILRVCGTPFEMLLCAHGHPLTRGASALISAQAQKMKGTSSLVNAGKENDYAIATKLDDTNRNFPPPHPKGVGPIIEIVQDVFWVRGSVDFALGPTDATLARMMFIVRYGQDLSIFNSIRLPPDVELDLEKLGTVKHVFKLGSHHGMDDPYYLYKYNAKFWAVEGMKYPQGVVPHQFISDSVTLPFPNSKAYVFKNAQAANDPEAGVYVGNKGGVMLVCDSLTNYVAPWEGYSPAGRVISAAIAGKPGAVFGPWLQAHLKSGGSLELMKKDVDNIIALGPWDVMLCAHGNPLVGKANQIVEKHWSDFKLDEAKEEKGSGDKYVPPHHLGAGPIVQIVKDVYWVQSAISLAFAPGKPTIARAMYIIRHNNELSLVNTVRLPPDRESELLALGSIKHVFSIGFEHGRDDPYYVEKFGATYWTMQGMNTRGLKVDRVISSKTSLPFADGSVHVLQAGMAAKRPEAVIHIARDGGVLMVCDFLTNHDAPWDFYSTLGKLITSQIKGKPGSVFGPWMNSLLKGGATIDMVKADVQASLALGAFDCLLFSHGPPLKPNASGLVADVTQSMFRKIGESGVTIVVNSLLNVYLPRDEGYVSVTTSATPTIGQVLAEVANQIATRPGTSLTKPEVLERGQLVLRLDNKVAFDDPTQTLEDVVAEVGVDVELDLVLKAKAVAETKSSGGGDKIALPATMKEFLEIAGLADFVTASLENGFDDVKVIPKMTDKEVDEWADAMSLKPGFKIKLRKACLAVR